MARDRCLTCLLVTLTLYFVIALISNQKDAPCTDSDISERSDPARSAIQLLKLFQEDYTISDVKQRLLKVEAAYKEDPQAYWDFVNNENIVWKEEKVNKKMGDNRAAEFLLQDRQPEKEVIRMSKKKISPESTGGSMIYAITISNQGYHQMALLTRLSHTLGHVDNLHWVVVEDASASSREVQDFLSSSGIRYTSLSQANSKRANINPNKDGGPAEHVVQYNLALSWIRKNVGRALPHGVVLFAGANHTFDLGLFDKIRTTNKMSVFPVGFTGGMLYTGPVVHDGSVTSWVSHHSSALKFPLDISGFAVGSAFFTGNKKAWMSYKMTRKEQVSQFLELLASDLKLKDIEVATDQVMVWRLETVSPVLDDDLPGLISE